MGDFTRPLQQPPVNDRGMSMGSNPKLVRICMKLGKELEKVVGTEIKWEKN